jgi:K+-transporting ATPase ATPase A chain
MANDGQSMASLNVDSVFYYVTVAIAMFAGRFALAGLAILLAGPIAQQGRLVNGPAVPPEDSFEFVALVLSVLAIVGAISFLPVLVLGPLAEMFAMVR